MRRLPFAALLALGCTVPQPETPAPAPIVRGPSADVRPTGPTRLRIIGSNDFHGALEPRPDEAGALRGGAAYFAAAIRKAEGECRQPECVTLLLDGGDAFQGTAASNFVFGKSVVGIFNYIGYSAAALGNHEFDWGQDTLRSIMKATSYPILGANVRYKDGRDVPWIPNDTLIRRGAFTVGIIGVSTVETPVTTMADKVADLSFVDPAPIIDSIAPTLRARGAQFVIVVGHIGARCSQSVAKDIAVIAVESFNCTGEAVEIARKVKSKIDAYVTGHSHTFVNADVAAENFRPKPTDSTVSLSVGSSAGGVPFVQGRSRGQAIDVVDLFLGGAAPHREVREVYSDSIEANADVRGLVVSAKAFLDKVAPHVNRPVAEIATTMRTGGAQYALGNLIADAMRIVGRGDIAIMNNGGIRQALPAGTANFGTLFEIQPFGNKLMRVRVRGSDLRAYFARALERSPNFHVSGTRIVYHTGATPGIDSITVLGRPLNNQSVYTVVLNDFSAGGGDRLGFGTAAISTVPAEVADIDALVAYLKNLPQPVKAPAEQRLIVRP